MEKEQNNTKRFQQELDLEEDEQLDMFCFMDESEQDKELYDTSDDVVTDSSVVTYSDLINPLCKSCENCQYKAITKHTKELKCTMYDCGIHRDFTECRGYLSQQSIN